MCGTCILEYVWLMLYTINFSTDNSKLTSSVATHIKVYDIYCLAQTFVVKVGLLPLEQIFPNGQLLAYLEIHDPKNRKTHVRHISHKVYTCT